jgi:hypothetical protein
MVAMTTVATPRPESGAASTPHTPSSASGTQQLEPSGPVRARDVVAFGREVGRMLSDGRIVGRAEPFAKVFASSRQVKRAVGATAGVILEDITLDATIDDHGRLVADTSVRHIADNVRHDADNLGDNKTTVARHLARLRAQQRDAAARALKADQEQGDRRMAGWAAALCEALTDTQLTAAVQRIARPVGGLDPLLRAGRGQSAPRLGDRRRARRARHAAQGGAHPGAARPRRRSPTARCSSCPRTSHHPHQQPTAKPTRKRFDDAYTTRISDLEASHPTRQPKLEGGSDAP